MSDDPFAEPTDTEATVIRPRPGGRSAATAPRTPAGPQCPPPPFRSRRSAPTRCWPRRRRVLAAAIRISSDRGRPPDLDRLRRGMVGGGARFRETGAGHRPGHAQPARRPLRAVRHHRRPGAQHALGQHQHLGGAEPDQHLPQRGHRRRTVLRHPRADAEGSRPPQRGGRADVSLRLARLRGPLPGHAARHRGADRAARSGLSHHPPAARRFRARAVAALAGLQTGYTPLLQRVPLWALGVATLGARLPDLCACSTSRSPARPTSPSPKSPACRRTARSSCRARGCSGCAGRTGRHRCRCSRSPRKPGRAELHQFLAPEIKAGLVEVLEDAQSVTVRLTNRNMFGSGSATLNPAYVPLLQRIGTALTGREGRRDWSTATPTTSRSTPCSFPSNLQLSQARADAVANVIESRTDRPQARARGRQGRCRPARPEHHAGRARNATGAPRSCC